MDTFHIEIKDKLAILTLDRGRSNPLNHQMVQELVACFHEFENDENVDGVILTGKRGFFSSGIDLMEAYSYNEEQSRAFWTDFIRMQTVLVSFKKPLVAAISGHSPAGGCVMAICCDYRLMADGPYIIGLNEIPVGIIVPDSVFEVYAFWLGQRKAYQYLLDGKLLKVNEALEAGLIDEVTTAEELLTLAEIRVRNYMKFNRVTWSQSKLNLRKCLIAKLDTDQSDTLDLMLKQWWSSATRKGLEVMIQQLQTKRS
jgi:enoyl-CoA hydratase/carnithine racemase